MDNSTCSQRYRLRLNLDRRRITKYIHKTITYTYGIVFTYQTLPLTTTQGFVSHRDQSSQVTTDTANVCILTTASAEESTATTHATSNNTFMFASTIVWNKKKSIYIYNTLFSATFLVQHVYAIYIYVHTRTHTYTQTQWISVC